MIVIVDHYPMIRRDFIIDHMTIPDDFFEWIHNYITEPISGFEHKRNPDGSFYTKRQQLAATRRQAIAIVHDFLKRGKSETEIFEILYLFRE